MKLERAESLITGLADERDRWELSLESYRAKLSNIPGDALLGAAFMSYAGPFTSTYRSHLVSTLRLKAEIVASARAMPCAEAASSTCGIRKNRLACNEASIHVPACCSPACLLPQVKDLWIRKLQEASIPCSADFEFTDFLVTPVEVRQWQLDGLPTDPFSAENGVLITKASKWPLIIDPQNQANRWIRKLKSSDITV